MNINLVNIDGKNDCVHIMYGTCVAHKDGIPMIDNKQDKQTEQ